MPNTLTRPESHLESDHRPTAPAHRPVVKRLRRLQFPRRMPDRRPSDTVHQCRSSDLRHQPSGRDSRRAQPHGL